jgi:hypothetical protein
LLTSLERIRGSLWVHLVGRCTIILTHICWWKFFIILILLSHILSSSLAIIDLLLLLGRRIVSSLLCSSSVESTWVGSIWVAICHNKVILAVEPRLIIFVWMWNHTLGSILNYHWIIVSLWRMRVIIRILIMVIVSINYTHHHCIISCCAQVMTCCVDTWKSSIVVKVMWIVSALHHVRQM